MVEVLKNEAVAAKQATLRNAVAVASGKGGVGKTWLSITLCHALARAGCKTLLFDGDLGLANVDIQLGLAPEQDLGGVIAGRYEMPRARVPFPTGGFEVIAGRSGSGSLAALPAQQIAALTAGLAGLAPSYDWLILDLGAGVERTVRLFASQARTCLVVTNDEPTALTDAYAFMKLSLMQRPKADLRIVVNMAESAADGERTYHTLRKACESFLKVAPPLAGIVRRDAKVKEAIQRQTPLLVRHPNAPAAHDIEALARRLMGER